MVRHASVLYSNTLLSIRRWNNFQDRARTNLYPVVTARSSLLLGNSWLRLWKKRRLELKPSKLTAMPTSLFANRTESLVTQPSSSTKTAKVSPPSIKSDRCGRLLYKFSGPIVTIIIYTWIWSSICPESQEEVLQLSLLMFDNRGSIQRR